MSLPETPKSLTETDRLGQAEAQIDHSFAASPLLEVGYTQAIWTLLSVNEDIFLKALVHSITDSNIHVFVDLQLNALTYPLRLCFTTSSKTSELQVALIDDHYKFALDWITAARDYANFCAIFPLWHRGRVKLTIEGDRLIVEHSGDRKLEYEAYNRLIRKEARPDPKPSSMPDDVSRLLNAATTVKSDWFRVNFNPRLVTALTVWLASEFDARHTLPEDWAFIGFTLSDYRKIYLTIQSIMFAWHTVRSKCAESGMPGLADKSSVWVVPRTELIARLTRYTGLQDAYH